MSNRYKNILKKSKEKQRKRRIYVSSDVLNELGYLTKNLKKDEEELDETDKSIIEMLEKLKIDEIIKYYEWGINSANVLNIYIYPIMEGTKPMILHDCLQSIGTNLIVRNRFF